MLSTLGGPSHRLDKVTVPVALMWSRNDWLADPKVSLTIYST